MTTHHYPDDSVPVTHTTADLTNSSAVSWSAIFAGALAAAVLSLALFMLGTGLGLSSISVWSGKGSDGDTIGWAAIAWLAFTQLASAGVGGYLAGRLRTKWLRVHSDEVYFRDTAHGFLAWGLATLIMAALMGSIVGATVSGAAKAVGTAVSGTAQAVGGVASTVGGVATSAVAGAAGATSSGSHNRAETDEGSSMDYWIEALFRDRAPVASQSADGTDRPAVALERGATPAENARTVATIFKHSIQSGSLSDNDANYVAQLIARNSDMTSEEAKKKVQDSFASVQKQVEEAKQKLKAAEQKAKESAEQARKATAYSLLWTFVALLIGALVGSICATIGGRQRDRSTITTLT